VTRWYILAVVFVGVTLVLVAVVGTAWLAPAGRGDVDSWSRAHGLRLTDGNRPMVGYYLRTARQLRGIGMVAGAVLPAFVVRAYGGGMPEMAALWGIAWAYVGYLVGSLYAELALARPGSSRRAASLEPRSLHAYLPRRHLWWQRAVAGGVVGGGALAAILGPAPAVWVEGYGTGREPAALLSVSAIVVAVVAEVLERWLIRRPQPLSRPDLVAADDAIRSQSVHSLCGSSLALLVLLAAAQAVVLAQRDLGDLRRPVFAAAAFGLFASYVTCMRFGHRAWRVQRAEGAVS